MMSTEPPNRRTFLGVASAALSAGAATSSSAAPPINPKASDIGPENNPLAGMNPSSFTPPETDHGEVKIFWSSFSLVHRRIQDGGWTRQINADTFPLSKNFTGVNMRLTAGGVRELHWHAAAEWAIMLAGNLRLTAIDNEGRSYVQDVTKNDLWYFPEGTPHSLQGLGPDGAEFLLVFNDGDFSEEDTTLISDWLVHTPKEVVAKNLGLPESALQPIEALPKTGKFIFQALLPPPLAEDRRLGAGSKDRSPVIYEFPMSRMAPTKKTASGEMRIVDTSNFPISEKIAMAHVIVKPGGMREMHWHQNSDEWQYYIAGNGRMTVFENASKARTIDFAPGDVGFVKRTKGHYIENTGNTDLIFLEMFLGPRVRDLSLSDWMTHTPPELLSQHLGISRETIARIPKDKYLVVPA